MRSGKLLGTIEHREKWIAAALLLLAAAIRLLFLAELPYGLNQDEASAGYEAWALLNFGIDRNGNSWPVLLVSWGSGQNILYTFLSMPLIASLGLNVTALRLTAGLLGICTVFVFWRLARHCRGVLAGLCALLLIAVNPWHVMVSRWALESNIMPLFLLLGIYYSVRSRKNPRWLYGAAVAFALALYAYGTAYFFIPLFVAFHLLCHRSLFREKHLYLAGGLFVLLALPITLCQLVNALGLEGFEFLGLTIPRLTQARQEATSVFGFGFAGIWENFLKFLRLLVTQSDGLAFNSMPKGGLYYVFGLPLALLGFARSLWRRRDHPEERPVRLALYAALICCVLIRVNVNRLNMVWLPLLYFQVLGLELLLRALQNWSLVPAAVVLLSFAVAFSAYGEKFGGAGNVNYFPGLGEALQCADALTDGTIHVTDYVNQPYIFALFYNAVDPELFNRTVDYINPEGAIRFVDAFAGYSFGGPEENVRAAVYVLHESETAGFRVLEQFGNYAVCVEG